MAKQVNNVKALDEVVVRPLGIKSSDLYDKIKSYDSYHKLLEETQDKVDTIKTELKEIGISEFKRVYDTEYKNPATIVIQAESMDNIANYKLISKATYSYKGDFSDLPSDLIIETESVKIDAKLVEKYYDEILKLISKSKVISEDDKVTMVTKKKDKSLAKDTISRLGEYKDTEVSFKPSLLLEKVMPQFAIGEPKIIEL